MHLKKSKLNSRRNFYHRSRKHTPGIPTCFITSTVRYVLLHCETIQLIFYYSLLKNIVHIVQCEGPLPVCYLLYTYIYLQSCNINENVRSVGVDWWLEIQQKRASKGQQRYDVSGAGVIIYRWTLLAAITASNYCGNHHPPETCTPVYTEEN